MQSKNLFPQTLLECVSAPRTLLTPGQPQKNLPTRIPAVVEVQSKDPREAVTSAVGALGPAGRREQPREVTPCPNTMVGQARRVKSPPNADQKRDGVPPTARRLHHNHIPRKPPATLGQLALHKQFGEAPPLEQRLKLGLSNARAGRSVFPSPDSTIPDSRKSPFSMRTSGAGACGRITAKTYLVLQDIVAHRSPHNESVDS